MYKRTYKDKTLLSVDALPNFSPSTQQSCPLLLPAVVPSLVKIPKYLNGSALTTTTTSMSIPFQTYICKKKFPVPIFRFIHSFLFLKLYSLTIVFHAKFIASVLTYIVPHTLKQQGMICSKCLGGRKTICFPFTP